MRDDGLLASTASSPLDDDTRMGGRAPTPPPEKPRHSLDSPKMRALLNRIRSWYDQEIDRQSFNRYQMALDSDYYDGLQWMEDDAQALIERGQVPVVYNEIKSSIDWMIGTERRTRIDYKVLPRRKEAANDAEVKTKLLKYLGDVNKETMARSRAFEEACKAGMGWLEVGVRGDQTDEPIYYRAQSWRQMLYDSNSVELDLSDARYLFRWKPIDLDVALAYFPDRASVIRRSVINADAIGTDEEDELWYLGARVTEYGQDYAGMSAGKYRPYDGAAFANSRRDRVKFTECWYREPTKIPAEMGDGSLYDKIVMQTRLAIYCDAGLVFESVSPYRHNRFPLIPVWAYRRARDNAPYGPVRMMRDPQDGANKRHSKALWILSSNKVVLEEGAVDDIEDLRDEIARPDSVIVKRRGAELEIDRDVQVAEEHLKLMEMDLARIRASGGVTAENLGRETNANSGRAIIARQDQGGVVTTQPFDNLRYAVQCAGEIELSLVEQFFTHEKVVRLVGDRGNTQFIEINKRDPASGEIINDITRETADYYVSAQDYRDSMRQAMFESLLDIVSRLAQMAPQVALNMLDLVIQLADIPNRDELVSRIRQLNGQRDPDSEPTPEEQQQMAAQAQDQAMQKELMVARAKAELAELEAKAGKLGAESVAKRLDAMNLALGAAQTVAAAPALGTVADEMMQGAGYADRAPQAHVDTAKVQRSAMAEAAAMAEQDHAIEQQQAIAQEQAKQPDQFMQAGMPPLPGGAQ